MSDGIVISEHLLSEWDKRLERMEKKIDETFDVKSRVTALETETKEAKEAKQRADDAHQKLREDHIRLAAQLGILKGLFIVLGAPIVVTLAARGVWTWMGGA